MALTANDARELSELFMQASHALGTYRFDNWSKLKKPERDALEDAAWDLLNFSTSMTTAAVGIALTDMETDLQAIKDATTKAKNAVAKIKRVKKAIGIAASLVVLGGAIISKDPGAIVKAV